MKLTPEQARVRATIAAVSRHHPDADTTELRTELRVATAEAYIRKLVDQAPPLSETQRARLAALLAPVGGAADG